MKMEHGDDDPRCALMKAHVRMHLWHGTLMNSKNSVDEDPCRALEMAHVPWHLYVGALSKKMEHVDDDLSYALRKAHAPWHYDVGALPKWRKSVDDDPHVALGDDDHVRWHSHGGADLSLRSHRMLVLPSRWGT